MKNYAINGCIDIALMIRQLDKMGTYAGHFLNLHFKHLATRRMQARSGQYSQWKITTRWSDTRAWYHHMHAQRHESPGNWFDFDEATIYAKNGDSGNLWFSFLGRCVGRVIRGVRAENIQLAKRWLRSFERKYARSPAEYTDM